MLFCCGFAATTSNAAGANQFCIFMDETAGAPKHSRHAHILTYFKSVIQLNLHFSLEFNFVDPYRPSCHMSTDVRGAWKPTSSSLGAPMDLGQTSFVLACTMHLKRMVLIGKVIWFDSFSTLRVGPLVKATSPYRH